MIALVVDHDLGPMAAISILEWDLQVNGCSYSKGHTHYFPSHMLVPGCIVLKKCIVFGMFPQAVVIGI